MPARVIDQFDIRYTAVKEFIQNIKYDAVAGRGGPLQPMDGGTYRINREMLDVYRSARYANHASNLGALLADRFATAGNVPSYIVDPVSTDEFHNVARISGVPGIVRKSRSHALNIKFCYTEACRKLALEKGNFIVAHLGGGFSIAAVEAGRIIDVNDALLGMGPFSVTRAGALPLAGMIDLVFNKKYNEKDLTDLLSQNSGLKGYLGTGNFKTVEKLVGDDDKIAIEIYRALIYQVSKEIGALYAVFGGHVTGIVITGGLAYSEMLVSDLKKYIGFIENILVFPGSFELQALAAGVNGVLSGTVQEKTYTLTG